MSTSPIDEKPSAPNKPRPAIRWQLIVLIIAMLLLIGSVIFMLVRPDGGTVETVGPRAEARTIPFIETNIYTEALVGEPVFLNPLLATSQADRDLASLLYSGLTRIDEYGQPVPDLAESWDVSSDGLTYTFTLRSDVKWHDGEPFTANDVAFTIDLLRDQDFPGSPDLIAFWRTVESYATDDQTIEFVLTQPLSAFPEYAGVGILPAHLVAADATALPDDLINTQPVGTGPMWWESTADEEGQTVVTLRPYADFHDASRRVKLDGVVFRFYPTIGDAFQAVGPQAQGYGGLSAEQLGAALDSDGLNLYTSPMPTYGAVLFNQQNAVDLPFFQEEEVRQALWMGLDRGTMISEVLGPQALVANSIIPASSWAYNSMLTVPPYDAAQAGLLLDEAGWLLEGSTRAREGKPIRFTLLVSDSEADRALGERIRDQWRALGIDVSVESVDPADLLERLQTADPEIGRDFHAALVLFSQGGLADPDPYAFWHGSQIDEGQNYSGFSDIDIDQALEVARGDANGVRRAELYREMQQWFLDQAAAVLLYNPVYHYAVSCQIDGVQLALFSNPSDRFRMLSEWRVLSPDEAAQACPAE